MKESICPKCNKPYKEHPAISRIDNKTEICYICSLKEALEAFEQNRKIKNEQARNS